MDRNISVVIRYRGEEKPDKTNPAAASPWALKALDQSKPEELDQIEDRRIEGSVDGKKWTYDRVYPQQCTTQQIYNEQVKNIVESCFSGYNGTIFAYGQTASGKTFTMHGDRENYTHGIIPYAVKDMFRLIELQQ